MISPPFADHTILYMGTGILLAGLLFALRSATQCLYGFAVIGIGIYLMYLSSIPTGDFSGDFSSDFAALHHNLSIAEYIGAILLIVSGLSNIIQYLEKHAGDQSD